jgi:CRP-like cAMP-binding protein
MDASVQIEIPYARNALLRQLPPVDIEFFRRLSRLIHLERDSVVYESDAPIHHVHFPVAGMITLLQKVDGAQTVDVAAVGANGVLGAIAAYGIVNSPSDAIVRVAGASLAVTAADFLEFYQTSPILRHLIDRSQTAMLLQAQQMAACNAVHSVEQRMCRWLLQIRRLAGGDVLPITQDAMAHMLGVQRTTVTLVEQRLKSAGIVRQRRGRVEILDLAALEACACKCDARIRRMHDDVSAAAGAAADAAAHRPDHRFIASPGR